MGWIVNVEIKRIGYNWRSSERLIIMAEIAIILSGLATSNEGDTYGL